MIKKFTNKETLFINACIAGKTDIQAWEEAGYSMRSTPATITTNIMALKKKPHISAELEKRRKKLQKKTEITAENLIEKLERVYFEALADDKKQYGAAVQAVMGQAKILGLIVDKAEIKAAIYRPEDLLDSIIIEAEARRKSIEHVQ